MQKAVLWKSGISAFLILFITLAWPAAARTAEYLTASGCSVSNVGYLTELAKEYERRSGVKVFIRGGGSIIGIDDLNSGRVDFAASCRPHSKGDPDDLTFIQVAWDALVFIVHPSNPLNNISFDSVRSLYGGTVTNWSQLKGRDRPIKIFISRSKSGLSGVEASTRDLVLQGKDPFETENMRFLASSGIVEQMVEETRDGFATTGFTSARKRKVKMLKVNGVAPTNTTIVQNRYPLKRPLFIVIPKKPKPEVKKFADFAVSTEGQLFIKSLHVISLRDVR